MKDKSNKAELKVDFPEYPPQNICIALVSGPYYSSQIFYQLILKIK